MNTIGRLSILSAYQNGGLVEVQSQNDSKTTYFIDPDHLGQAFNSDEVEIDLSTATQLTDAQKTIIQEYSPLSLSTLDTLKSIKIIQVMTRHSYHQKISGILKIKSNTVYGIGKNGGQYYLFCPTDPKYPNFTVLSRAKSIDYQNHIYIVTKYQEWLPTSKYPRGCCEEIIGEVGQLDHEISTRLYHHHLAFPSGKKAIKDELHQLEHIHHEMKGRQDFRNLQIFSIDPPGCKDVDDALHLISNADGYTIGIHIADVSTYVKPGSQLDLYAKQRMTSLYLPNETKHMLPPEISEGCCSLLEGQERYALSLILQVDFNGQIGKWDFQPSIIKNHRQFTYAEAEKYLADPESTKSNQYSRKLAELQHLLKKINQGGKYYTSSSETLGDTTPNAHYVVETCMVLANIFCAEKLIEMYGNCIVRHHEHNNQDYLEASMKVLEDNGQQDDADLNHYLKMRSQVSAQYHSLQYLQSHSISPAHFGLNAKHYTHFTSPIRRYVDLVNHRLLKGEIADLKNLDQICVSVNEIHTNAKRLYRDLSYLNLINQYENNYTEETELVTRAVIVEIIQGQPSLKVRLYLPEYKLTLQHTICHFQVKHLYEVTSPTPSKLTLKNMETEEICQYNLFQTIRIILTPILNSLIFSKKIRIKPF